MTTAGRGSEPRDPIKTASAVGPLGSGGPILAASGTSAANASHPETPLDDAYHIYDAHPAPWWIGVLWVAFFVFAVTYLITNIIE